MFGCFWANIPNTQREATKRAIRVSAESHRSLSSRRWPRKHSVVHMISKSMSSSGEPPTADPEKKSFTAKEVRLQTRRSIQSCRFLRTKPQLRQPPLLRMSKDSSRRSEISEKSRTLLFSKMERRWFKRQLPCF